MPGSSARGPTPGFKFHPKRTEKARISTPDLLRGRSQAGFEEVRKNIAYSVVKSTSQGQ